LPDLGPAKGQGEREEVTVGALFPLPAQPQPSISGLHDLASDLRALLERYGEPLPEMPVVEPIERRCVSLNPEAWMEAA
jgi:hypothetical protein